MRPLTGRCAAHRRWYGALCGSYCRPRRVSESDWLTPALIGGCAVVGAPPGAVDGRPEKCLDTPEQRTAAHLGGGGRGAAPIPRFCRRGRLAARRTSAAVAACYRLSQRTLVGRHE